MTRDADLPAAGTATVHVLQAGYIRDAGADQRVGSTVTLIQDGNAAIIVDPGFVASRLELLAALAGHGVQPESVTDIVFSHHHPDHTVNAALFPAARIHDYQAIYDGDRWIDRDADGFELSPSVVLIATPGHTPQDITTLAATADGVHACTHAWWTASGPADDPYAPDPALLSASRARILAVAQVIIPGHAQAFRPDQDTPR
jgi:glyoxylase-like metal-dependent hydrolase (beta-lactamase superfamily II)